MDVRPRWQRRRRRPGGERGDGGRRAALVRHRRRPVRDRAHPVGRGPRARRQRLGRRRAPMPRRCAPRGFAGCRCATTCAASPCPAASTAGCCCTSDSARCRSGRSSCRRSASPRPAPRPARCCARRSPCSTTTPRRGSSSWPSRRANRARSCAARVWRSPCRRSSGAVATRSTAERSAKGCSSSAMGCSTPTTSIGYRRAGSRCSPSRCSATSCTRSGRRRRATSPWPSPGSSNGSGCPARRTTSSAPTCSSRP